MARAGVGAALDCRRAVFWVLAGAWLVARVETSAPAVKTMPPEVAEERELLEPSEVWVRLEGEQGGAG